jgi:hypothetical protein
MFENTVPRRRFGSKMEKVSGGLRKLHTAKLHNLYSSLILLKRRKLYKDQMWRMYADWEDETWIQHVSWKT